MSYSTGYGPEHVRPAGAGFALLIVLFILLIIIGATFINHRGYPGNYC
ncbi:YjcZ family sporulation protein [Psychrobacillus sp. NPDC093200]